MTDDRCVLRDPELFELVVDEPELLAILDAYAATQRPYWPERRQLPLQRLGLLAAAVAAIAVPAAAFADQIGQILGFSNSGTPVAENRLPGWQLSALQAIGFPTQGVRFLGKRAGVTFYVSKQADGGGYCFGIGLAPAPAPRIDALACGSHLGSFPSSTGPIADLSGSSPTSGGQMEVTKLAGFATDAIARVELLDAAGNVVYATPAASNIYAADDVPRVPVNAIAAVDSEGKIVYQKQLAAPQAPQPSTSASPTTASRTPLP